MSVDGPRAQAERIGLLGGTFDPPHAGHLAAAVACRDALLLDRVLLMVANHPWQKTPLRSITAAEDRYCLVAAAASEVEGVEPSRIEIDRGGPSYTIDTVRALHQVAEVQGRARPDIFLIVGADLAETLDTWSRVDQLRRLVTLVVVARPPGPVPTSGPDGWQSVVVGGDGGVDVSSSEVRALIGAGQSVEGLVPESVVHCILRRGLYSVSR
jgi:nicotinate-nucleotide adenylyltransferase